MARDHVLTVRLDDDQLARVDAAVGELAGTRGGVLRAAALAQLDASAPDPVPSRGRALLILAEAAEGGNVAAAIALERALRLDDGRRPEPPVEPAVEPAPPDDGFGEVDELYQRRVAGGGGLAGLPDAERGRGPTGPAPW